MDYKFCIAVVLLAVLVVTVFCLIAAWKFRQLRRQLYQELKDMNTGNTEEDTAREDESVWDRFLPRRLLHILDIKEKDMLSEKFLEEQIELQVGIMNINQSGFQTNIQRTSIKEAYRLINQMLACCIPYVADAEGSITSFHDAGLTAVFTGDAEKELNAAVSICEKMRKLPEKDRQYGQLAIGICHGSVMFGVVGYGERLSVLTLSSYTGLGRFLQRMASKYNAKILATGSYLEQIPDFQKKYNCRFLGYIRIENNGAMEKIYDVFDGDEPSVRNQKRKTKMVFEEGVNLFLEGSHGEARLHFIEVLKTDRYDRAAMEYVLLCEKYAEMGEEHTKEIYIEVYE